MHRLYGSLPLSNLSAVRQAELVAAGLSAGYGKKFSWSRNYVGPAGNRAPLYKYLRRKLETVLACVEVSSGRVRPRPFWNNIEPTEKAVVSFNLGSIGAALAATRWMQGAGHTVTRFLHTRLFIDAAVVKKPIALIGGDQFPDYLVQDSAGGWHVFEAKGGGDAGARWRQLAQGLQQLLQVTGVGEIRAVGPPSSAVCVQTLIRKSSNVEFTLVDPPSQIPGSGASSGESSIELQVVPEIADLLLTLEATEWFSCFDDGLQSRASVPDLVASKLLGFRMAQSAAFGGMQIALPEEFFDIAPGARSAVQVIEYFKAAVRSALEEDDGKSSLEKLISAVRTKAQQGKVSAGPDSNSKAIQLATEALHAALELDEQEDLHSWQANVIKKTVDGSEMSRLSARM